MKNEIKIPVSEGTELIARAQKGNDYPGIWVYLVKDGEEVLLAVVEKDTLTDLVAGYLYRPNNDEPASMVVVEKPEKRKEKNNEI